MPDTVDSLTHTPDTSHVDSGTLRWSSAKKQLQHAKALGILGLGRAAAVGFGKLGTLLEPKNSATMMCSRKSMVLTCFDRVFSRAGLQIRNTCHNANIGLINLP